MALRIHHARLALAGLALLTAGGALLHLAAPSGDGHSASPRASIVTALEPATRSSVGPGTAERPFAGEKQGDTARSVLARGGERHVALELVRWPDGEPIARAFFRLDVGGEQLHLRTDAESRCELALPADASALTIELAGFEPAAADARAPSPLRIELRPLSGLCGRVVDQAGAPVADALVRAEVDEEFATVREPGHASGRVQVHLQRRVRPLASARSSASGWYLLAVPTRSAGPPCRVRATGSDGTVASLALERPRAFEPLPDLVLGAGIRLRVRVVDEADRPVRGALVSCEGAPRDEVAPLSTDERGELSLCVPALPARLQAATPDRRWVLVGQRIDGEEHPPRRPVESAEQRVELVLREMRVAAFRVLERESRAPVALAAGSVTLLDVAGRPCGSSEFQTDADGLGHAWLEQLVAPGAQAPEVAAVRVGVRAWHVLSSAPVELSRAELSADAPVTILVDGPPGSQLLRGRVLRGGAPAARFQLGAVGLVLEADGSARTSIVRCMTDAEGRFATRWSPRDPRELVAVMPHWTVFDEFGALGPMTGAEAARSELVLEIEPGLRVPIVVRGAQPGGRYVATVELLGERGAVPVTINGAPLELADGEQALAFTHVPAHAPSRVSIGYATEHALHPRIAAPVVFDPAAPVLPLVFELPPIYVRVAGAVAGFAPDELEGAHVVAAVLRDASDAASGAAERYTGEVVAAAVGADGRFVLERLLRGPHELLLVLGHGEPLARLVVEIDRDSTGVVLARGE